MTKYVRFLGLFLIMSVLVAGSAYDQDFYKKEYAHLGVKIPASHIEKLYKYRKQKVQIMVSNLPTIITLSVKVVWNNISSPDGNQKKKSVAWAAAKADKSKTVSGDTYDQGSKLTEHFKESYLALNDYLHLVVMDSQLKSNPKLLSSQQETIETYKKTELFTVTPTQDKEIAKNKAERAHAANQKYNDAFSEIQGLNSPDPKADLGDSVKQVQKLQDKVQAAFEEVNGYLEMAALQIQTVVKDQPAYAAGAQQGDAEQDNQNQQQEFKVSPDDPLITPQYQFDQKQYQADTRSFGRRSARVLRWSEYIVRAANKYHVDPALIAAIIEQESGGNENAISRTGAIGLMQLMPGTARGLGVNPYDPAQNIEGGAKYIAIQLNRFGGDENLALAAYNAGPGNALRWQSIRETSRYVNNVPRIKMKYVDAFKEQ